MVRHSICSWGVHRAAGLRGVLWSGIGAAAVGMFSAVAAADRAPGQQAVSYADLDLSSQQDAKILYKRLQRASRHVCREFDGRDLSRLRLRQACYAEALSSAVENVDHTVLTALHADKQIRLAGRNAAAAPRS